MSFKGVIEARCPKGCEPFETEVWSFIHGARSPELREAAAAGECNLLLCPQCGGVFFAQAPFVYFEPEAEILAFIFPESYRGEEPRWSRKMHEDFLAFKQAMGKQMPIATEPEIFFGPKGLSELLKSEDSRAEEREVMERVAEGLGLSIFRLSPRLARRRGIPASLPYKGKEATRAHLIAGLERLLEANDRLSSYQACLKSLRKGKDDVLFSARSVHA